MKLVHWTPKHMLTRNIFFDLIESDWEDAQAELNVSISL